MKRQNQETKTVQDVENPAGAKLDRRAFVRLGAVGAALGSLPLWSTATTAQAADTPATAMVSQPPLPVVDARFPCRIADGIWLIPDKRIFLVPNIGIVEGSRSVLVIDSGLTPDSGRGVLEAARALAGKRDLILTVTHAHPEHTFGAQAFKGQARIYYNQLQRDYLARAGQKILERFRRVTLSPDRAYLLDQVQITLADDVYEGNHASLDLGGRTVEFRTWGTAHSPGDQIIVVPDQGVTFAGDLIEERMFPIVPFYPPLIGASDIDVHTWQTALGALATPSTRLIVPGHGNLGGTEIARAVSDYFEDTRKLVTSSGVGKTAAPEAVARLESVVFGRHPTWEHTQFIAPALRYFVEQAGA